MFDQITGAESNLRQVCQSWCTNWMASEGMARNKQGELTGVIGYYDPEIDEKHFFGSAEKGAGMGLGVAWYLLPQGGIAAELALEMYRAAVKEFHWADTNAPVNIAASGVRNLCLGCVLAHELGDTLVEQRLVDILEVVGEPRNFGDGEFGFWFNIDEPYPRGQFNALLMCSEVGHAGGWQRAFNRGTEAHAERYSAPTVEGVDFPLLGLSQAINDTSTGVLTVSTYAATPSRTGEATEFCVVQLPAGVSVKVECDGQSFTNFKQHGNRVTITTTVDTKTFEIFTGYIKTEDPSSAFCPVTYSHAMKARL
jgi:hypothetical protein